MNMYNFLTTSLTQLSVNPVNQWSNKGFLFKPFFPELIRVFAVIFLTAFFRMNRSASPFFFTDVVVLFGAARSRLPQTADETLG